VTTEAGIARRALRRTSELAAWVPLWTAYRGQRPERAGAQWQHK
jgi:hypothetical protein